MNNPDGKEIVSRVQKLLECFQVPCVHQKIIAVKREELDWTGDVYESVSLDLGGGVSLTLTLIAPRGAFERKT